MLQIENITVKIDHNKIVSDVSFNLKKGEISCLLGPSGCGKTTLLRAIAGFLEVSQGRILLDGRAVSKRKDTMPPEKRKVGMVFQDFALFPHLSIKNNILFGIRKLSKKQQLSRIQEMLAMVNMQAFAERYPHELSGGQQQRVAIARALAPKPKLLLLDEPFSSLDVELRQELALDIKAILQKENITALMVTHEQSEAFSIAENIGVMNEGVLQQWDLAYSLYHQPKNSFVADFIGEGVLIKGEVIENDKVKTSLLTLEGKTPNGCSVGCPVQVLIRPDDIVHDDCSALNGKISGKIFRGSHYLYVLNMPDGTELLSMVHSHHDHNIGETLGIVFELEHLVVFPEHQNHFNKRDSQ